jgi:hypothetical protein
MTVWDGLTAAAETVLRDKENAGYQRHESDAEKRQPAPFRPMHEKPFREGGFANIVFGRSEEKDGSLDYGRDPGS